MTYAAFAGVGSFRGAEMAWTWDRYRDWQHDERKERQQPDPLRRFIATVDVMFYAAAGALMLSIIAVLVS